MNERVTPPDYRSFDDLPSQTEIGFGEIVGIDLSSHTSPFTHGLHRYPAKFIPQIPRWAIKELSRPGEVVLDPFMGSGTTIVESLLADRVAHGIDLDPLACLIAQAKTAQANRLELRHLQEQLASSVLREEDNLIVPMAGVKNFEHWFSRATWGTLQNIRNKILTLDCSEESRAFLLCVFSSILRRVSNADDQTQKTYVSGTLRKNPPAARPTFFRALERAINSLDSFGVRASETHAHIHRASATAMPIADQSIDLIVTSPPYLDSVDYMYNMMVEYFWLGDVLGIPHRKDFNAARKLSVGGKKSQISLPPPSCVSELIDFNELPDYRKAAAASYFSSMDEHFREAARVLKTGRQYVLVIGNSQTEKGQLPVHDALVSMASTHGFSLQHAFGYRIRRHYMKFPRKGRGGIILMDWVIILKNEGHGPTPLRRLPMPEILISPDAVAH
ncbi:DNA modification methylase [Rhizobium sp. BK212]|uniref:DNA methyltransferase n=1 Tax=Rhizobium sp. BK212 TaxID=2587074 RepID=UPI00160AD6AF|nr:DNA methyltransferase [Rhizobium sp. BK212]MBB4216261.1 DNA modification methylase [Rhizobium sp. BK212]